MSFEEEFPSLVEDSKIITIGEETLQYIAVNGGYYATEKELTNHCLDKQRVKDFLSSRVNDESGMVVFSYTEIKELGLE